MAKTNGEACPTPGEAMSEMLNRKQVEAAKQRCMDISANATKVLAVSKRFPPADIEIGLELAAALLTLEKAVKLLERWQKGNRDEAYRDTAQFLAAYDGEG